MRLRPRPPMPVKLYDTPRAPNPRRVRIFLAEKGIELPTVAVSILEGEHKRPRHLAHVGSHNLPALELEDGTVLTESVTICRYLEAIHPLPNLMGADPLEVALVDMWQRRVELGLYRHVTDLFRHTHPRMAHLEDQVPEWGEANRSRVAAALGALDARLAEADFVAGDGFSIADITAFVAVDYLRVTRTPVPETLTALIAWRNRMAGRPGVVD
jgi:glutathione S-transferase